VLANKKSQGVVVDIALLLILSTLAITFLSTELNRESISTAAIRSQNLYTRKLLSSTLYFSRANTSVADMIKLNYCGYNKEADMEDTIEYIISKLNRKEYNYILTICPEGDCASNAIAICSKEVSDQYGGCCVKTKSAIIASANLTLPNGCNYNFTIVSLGIWPKSMKVEKC